MPRMFLTARDPWSSYTHYLGALLSVVGAVLLAGHTLFSPDYSTAKLVSVLIFSFSMILLYSASSIYHFVKASNQAMFRLRKLDHAMIFVLIAGTYTPILMNLFQPDAARLFTIGIWALCGINILLKLCWFQMPRWLSTLLYLMMGWIIVVDLASVAALGPGGILLLVLGGAFYTVGGVIYAVKKPNLSEAFGFHELFHIFVMLGTLCHYLTVYWYII